MKGSSWRRLPRRILGRVFRPVASGARAVLDRVVSALENEGTPAKNLPLEILLPLNRTAYATNEWIQLAVVRRSAATLPAATLTLAITGPEASRIDLTFPLPEALAVEGAACATEHIHLNGWLLRPGHYTIGAAVEDESTSAVIEVFSHVRKTTFKLIDWGSGAEGADLISLGEDGMGFNLIYGCSDGKAGVANAEAAMRGGADFIHLRSVSDGHQVDEREECDWSDPYVVRGVVARAARQAFINRTSPNAFGVHFCGEPGLTIPSHTVPSQHAGYRSCFGVDAIPYRQVRTHDVLTMKRWAHWVRWRQSLMDMAWKNARLAVEQVRPDFVSTTQSVYGWFSQRDGHYFNVVHSLPIISGHGGYDDAPGTYFYPSFCLAFGRARNLNKPLWYMPVFFPDVSSEAFRLEQYLSFIQGLQGMAKSPEYPVHQPASTRQAEGILECNKVMERLGTVFTTMPASRSRVAVLYSLSQSIAAQMQNIEDIWGIGSHALASLLQVYLASTMIHIPFFPILEEDVLDGSLAAHHQAVVLAGIHTLDPPVIAALEEYARLDGLVILTADCRVSIRDAIRLEIPADIGLYNRISQLRETEYEESMRQGTASHFMKAAQPLSEALKSTLKEHGIEPELRCDNPNVAVSRHQIGDIEYSFAVNANPDEHSQERIALRESTAMLSFSDDDRPIYDAVRSGRPSELEGSATEGSFRFGAGQMRVFARTARPIGGVQVMTPVLFKDYTLENDPIHVKIGAVVTDPQNRALAGSIPLQVRVTDPLGVVRYDLYRATNAHGLTLTLPLAANDPAGEWRIEVTELLNRTRGTAVFTYTPAAQCGAVAGAVGRAVVFGQDRENIFRFFRSHHQVTIVRGSSEYCIAAAARLAESLEPWGVHCVIVDAARVNKPRKLSAQQKRTWIGLEPGRGKRGSWNRPARVGFALDGPAILLGCPMDNPLISTVKSLGFLPYRPGPDFPGRGRGMIAWQRDAIGPGQESITLIAYDTAGMAEAVGTLYEMAAGMEPLTRLQLPASARIVAAAQRVELVPEPTTAWEVTLPDRALTLQVMLNHELLLTTLDGSRTRIDGAGRILSQTPIDAGTVKLAGGAADAANDPAEAIPKRLEKRLLPHRVVKQISQNGSLTAVGYWGGTLEIFNGQGDIQARQRLSQDISALCWQGGLLVVGLSDGRVMALDVGEGCK